MGTKLDLTRRETDREPRSQYAALPWRLAGDGAVEVLLITSRETRRWVIPKGWPIRGMKSKMSAAREAFEEAGIEGQMGKKLGLYHYQKRLRSGRIHPVRVAVYPMQVAFEHEDWPEKGQREKHWLGPDEASVLVEEAELQAIIAAFRPA
jgi:8-oxo-dGTP pyrophosphatase MutT (NUDIX family)